MHYCTVLEHCTIVLHQDTVLQYTTVLHCSALYQYITSPIHYTTLHHSLCKEYSTRGHRGASFFPSAFSMHDRGQLCSEQGTLCKGKINIVSGMSLFFLVNPYPAPRLGLGLLYSKSVSSRNIYLGIPFFPMTL